MDLRSWLQKAKKKSPTGYNPIQPGVTLAPSIEPFVQYLCRKLIELPKAGKVAYQSIVVVVSPQFSVQFLEEMA